MVVGGQSVIPHKDYWRAKERPFSHYWPVPERYKNASLVDGEGTPSSMAENYRAASEWCRSIGPDELGAASNLIVFGGLGSGKSHLAGAICNFLRLRVFLQIIWTNAPEIISRVKATYSNPEGETQAELIQEFSDCELLIVDDFDKFRATDNSCEVILEIIFRRYDAKLPTLITTNATAEEISGRSDTLKALIDKFKENARSIRMDTRVRKGVGK